MEEKFPETMDSRWPHGNVFSVRFIAPTDSSRFREAKVLQLRACQVFHSCKFFLLSPFRVGLTLIMCKEGRQRKIWRASMRVRFDQKNRRRNGSQSHARYEKYKVAATINHAWHLGASLLDLDTDLARGYVEILDDGALPEVVPVGHDDPTLALPETALPIENDPESEPLETINPFRNEAVLPPELQTCVPNRPILSELPKTRDACVQTQNSPVEQDLVNATHEAYALRQVILEYKFGTARIRRLSARAEHEMMCS